MNTKWQSIFRNRMRGFEALRPPDKGEVAVSIKIRVTSGCFHREHSPHAYKIIDQYLISVSFSQQDVSIQEHESGPELLVYLAVTTAGVTLAKSVIDLIITIIRARSESVKKGDRPSEPLELIVRRVHKKGEFREEKILRIGHSDPVNPDNIQEKLNKGLNKLIQEDYDKGNQ